MKFAVNYSFGAEEVFNEIQPYFDYFKCNEWPTVKEPAKKLKPIYIHFPNNIGNKQGEPDWKMIENNLRESASSLVNTHLLCTVENYPHIPIDSVERLHKEEIIYNAIQDILPYIEHFGAENIMMENLPYWTPRRPDEIGVVRACTEPDVITAILEATNIGLLFDIDHARTACYYSKTPIDEYVQQLPMKRLTELHMTGTRMYENWLEAHLEMHDEDWQYFEWALKNIADGTWGLPQIFANEYGGIGPHFAWRSNPKYIAEQTPKFASLLKKYRLRN
jgi:uncharacterized protein